MADYKTVGQVYSRSIEEKKSEFIRYISHIKDEADAANFLNKIRKKHYDARHRCYAYILKEGGVQRQSDDGEPQKTAGMPILEVLRHSGLEDVIIVVVRYFGGTLLGTGGLVRAYTAAAQSALSGAEILSYSLCVDLEINIDYPLYDRVVALCRSDGGKVIDTVYAENVKLQVRMVSGPQQKLIDDLMPLTKGKIPHVSDEFYEIF